jgi:hypothetical protein
VDQGSLFGLIVRNHEAAPIGASRQVFWNGNFAAVNLEMSTQQIKNQTQDRTNRAVMEPGIPATKKGYLFPGKTPRGEDSEF